MFYESAVLTCIHPAYRKLIAPVRKSKALARLLFGIKHMPPDGVEWDWVTLGLRQALKKEALDYRSFLDMGCGRAAILSIYAHKRGCQSITAVDIVKEFVDSAEACLFKNEVEASVLQSDFGNRLTGQSFDIIVWNATYIPEKWGKYQGLDKKVSSQIDNPTITWSGGDDGTRSIRKFLEEIPHYLSQEGKILLGFNKFYVRLDRVKEIVSKQRLRLNNIMTFSFIPAIVLVIT